MQIPACNGLFSAGGIFGDLNGQYGGNTHLSVLQRQKYPHLLPDAEKSTADLRRVRLRLRHIDAAYEALFFFSRRRQLA